MNIAIIPARGGSRRIPRKNIKPFHGKPIIAYSIETAKASGLFAEVCVSTDDEEIAEVAADYGAIVLARPAYLAEDDIGTQEVMKYAIQQAETLISESFDYACCAYPTAPMMTVDGLKWGFCEVVNRSDIAYSFSVGCNPLQDAGQFYWGRIEAFLYDKPLIWPNVAMIPIQDNRVCDINYPDDWLRAERMYADLHREVA